MSSVDMGSSDNAEHIPEYLRLHRQPALVHTGADSLGNDDNVTFCDPESLVTSPCCFLRLVFFSGESESLRGRFREGPFESS